MIERFAAIDLGTNTFHILIAEKTNQYPFFKEIFRKRVYVYLGKKGVSSIETSSFLLGIETLKEFKLCLDKFKVAKCKVIGTEALRIADNGSDFITKVKGETNLDIQVIPGLSEANYIYQGVKAFIPKITENTVIMDIGGGSVEFIIFDNEKVLWAHSFPIGISVLYNRFQKNDPLTSNELEEIKTFIEKELRLLKQKCQEYKVNQLVGSAGSFEIVKTMLEERGINKTPMLPFDIKKMYKDIIELDLKSREKIPGLPKERTLLMPIAMHLLITVLDLIEIEKVLFSPYALKEGVLFEMVSN